MLLWLITPTAHNPGDSHNLHGRGCSGRFGTALKLLEWISKKWASIFGSRRQYPVYKRSLDSGRNLSRERTRTGVVSFLAPNRRGHGTCDEIHLLLQDLSIMVQREIMLDVPFEMTVVVPRAEISKKYQNGELIETNLVYSGITISHSPRYPEGRR